MSPSDLTSASTVFPGIPSGSSHTTPFTEAFSAASPHVAEIIIVVIVIVAESHTAFHCFSLAFLATKLIGFFYRFHQVFVFISIELSEKLFKLFL